MKYLIGLLVLAAAFIGIEKDNGFAYAQDVCVSAEQVQEVAKKNGHTIVQMTDAQRLALQAEYNSIPPVSNEVFNAAYVAWDPKKPGTVALLFFKAGCMFEPQVIPRDYLEKIIGRGA